MIFLGGGYKIQEAKCEMISYLNHLASVTDYLVFQMGFNWGGDINRCLFEYGTKKEMEDFIQKGTENYWAIEKIGIPVQKNTDIVYEDVCPENNRRIDAMGEFLNRPLFIMKSGVYTEREG